ncbi:MAG: hypothetical protein EA409_08705 [Saprospirales bacterium]|nr:MAG: hypothetical protein EA409_08705 [Saprospirales bacterium]
MVLPAMVISCGDFDDDNLDFSNSLNPYVEINSPPVVVLEPGESFVLPVVIRVAIQSDLNVSYVIEGDMMAQSEVVIPANSLSASIMVPALNEEGQATVTITGATSDGNEEFSIGRGDAALGLSRTSVVINWVMPDDE